MNEPNRITEADVQKLANILGCIVCANKNKDVGIFKNLKKMQPKIDGNEWAGPVPIWLPIRIFSTRPGTEQIWRPE